MIASAHRVVFTSLLLLPLMAASTIAGGCAPDHDQEGAGGSPARVDSKARALLAGAGPSRRTAATLVHVGVPVPANGSFLLEARNTRLGEVKLEDDAGKVIGGTATERFNYIVWTPERALVVGKVHTLRIKEVSGVGPENVYNIEVVAPRTRARPALRSSLALKRSERRNEACCEGLNCFPSLVDTSVELRVTLESTTARSDLSQLLFSVTFGAVSDPAPLDRIYSPLNQYGPGSEFNVFSSSTAWPEYCAMVAAAEIVGSETYEFAELEPHCVAHGDLGELGPMVLRPADALLSREKCSMPPYHQVPQWCEVNEECRSNGALPGCQKFDELCCSSDLGGRMSCANERDAGVSVGGSGGAGGSAGASGASSEAGAGGTREPSESSSDAKSDDSHDADGCGVVQPVSNARSGAWTFFIASFVMFAWRRRRQRISMR